MIGSIDVINGVSPRFESPLQLLLAPAKIAKLQRGQIRCTQQKA
jgi:hypothetical protein